MLWISDTEGLAAYCQSAGASGLVAVDTEFVWERTYYPLLGLIQLAYDGGEAALVDPLAPLDSTPLRRLLEAENITKVFHEAASDLPILHRWCGAWTKNIFDTRIAAGFADLTATLSLSKLITIILGVELPKTETRTDWLQRPLTEAQLQYASDDVAYMPKLCIKLRERLDQLENTSRFLETMAEYEQQDYYDPPAPEDAWKRVSGWQATSGAAFNALKRLAAWRESYARDNDIARQRIISDQQIVLATTYKAKTVAELKKHTGMWQKNLTRYGEAIVEVIKAGLTEPIQKDQPDFHQPYLDSRVLKQRSDRVLSLIRKRAEQAHLDPTLLGTRRDAESFVYAMAADPKDKTHRLLQGWKGQLLEPTIHEIIPT